MLSSQLTVGIDPAAATSNFEKLTTNLTGVYVGHPPELFIYYIKNHFLHGLHTARERMWAIYADFTLRTGTINGNQKYFRPSNHTSGSAHPLVVVVVVVATRARLIRMGAYLTLSFLDKHLDLILKTGK